MTRAQRQYDKPNLTSVPMTRIQILQRNARLRKKAREQKKDQA